tara:strand:+ start:93 stop:716 length:624 start_codon:yes stop_codon:yes gene_type:complete
MTRSRFHQFQHLIVRTCVRFVLEALSPDEPHDPFEGSTEYDSVMGYSDRRRPQRAFDFVFASIDECVARIAAALPFLVVHHLGKHALARYVFPSESDENELERIQRMIIAGVTKRIEDAPNPFGRSLSIVTPSVISAVIGRRITAREYSALRGAVRVLIRQACWMVPSVVMRCVDKSGFNAAAARTGKENVLGAANRASGRAPRLGI